MNKQEDINKIIAALATRGLECDTYTAETLWLWYLANIGEDWVPVTFTHNEICDRTILNLHAKQPEWQEITEKMPNPNEPVLWTNGTDVSYGKGIGAATPGTVDVTHWMRIDLPKSEPKCKVCSEENILHNIGVCKSCLITTTAPFTRLVTARVIFDRNKDGNRYNKALCELMDHMPAFEALDILLNLWEA